MAVAEQTGPGVEVFFDLFGRGLGRSVAQPLDDGAGQDVRLAGLDLLQHTRIAIQLECIGLAQQQLLIDQALQDQGARRVDLFGPQTALLLEHEIDLVDSDLVLVDAGRRLAGRRVFLAAAGNQQDGQKQQDDHLGHHAWRLQRMGNLAGLMRHRVSCNSRPCLGSGVWPAATAVAWPRCCVCPQRT